jgi:nicotinamidase-related amidase
MTQNCDASTVIHAVHAGFTVEFLSDAIYASNQAARAGAQAREAVTQA